MSKSWQRHRIERYMEFPETRFREGVYALGKALQAQGLSLPQDMQDYVNHVDAVRREVPKPDTTGGTAA